MLFGKTANLSPMQSWFGDAFQFFVRPADIFRTYQKSALLPDVLAGLTVAVVLLPQAIAYALIAELPPQVGLYGAIMAAIVAPLWGSSAHLHTGPTNAGSLLAFATLIAVALPGTPEYLAAAGLLAVMVGIARIFFGTLRLGVLVNFVSDSVIIGFTAGAGVLISVNQLRPLLRIDVPRSPAFYLTVIEIVRHIYETHLLSLGLGVGTIIVILILKRFRPKWPATLMGMITAAVAVVTFDLSSQGVIVLGELPRTLPPLASLPLFDLGLIGQLSTGALAISLIGLVEAMSIARSIAAQSGQRLNSNQEFIGQGLANIASGFLSGYNTSGSFTRSAVNYGAGAQTALASVFSGLWVLIAVLLFAPWAAYLPRTALAGVLIVTAYGMIDRQEMKRIWHASRGDTGIMVATILGTLLLPLQFAVLAGIIASIFRFLVKTSTPRVQAVVPDEDFKHFVSARSRPACPQLGIITVSGPLYFGAIHHVEDVIHKNLERNPSQRLLLLRLHLVDHLDVSGIHMLESVVRLYRQRGGDVYISGLHKPVMKQMKLLGFDQVLGLDHFFDRERSIPYLFHHVLEPSICIYECDFRVFAECQALPKWIYGEKVSAAVALPEVEVEAWLPSQLKEQLNGAEAPNLLLIDVREPPEYNKGHIAHSRLIPLRSVVKEGENFPTEKPIILVCRIGRRSRMAAAMLKNMGHEQVYNLQGGVLAWEAAGYPLAVE